jgi:hypothetical protein
VKLQVALLLSLVFNSNLLFAQASSGYDGSDGKDGDNQIITALDPVTINLSGGNGESGGDGSDGSSGRCDSYTNSEGETVNNDSSGEDGGRGGNGGDGGDGGNLTVLFSDIVGLSNIQFISRGGKRGYGGDGGEGGYGCPSGSDGQDGYSGDDGKAGNLYLVSKEFFPYQKDSSNQFNKVSELINGRNIVKNIWEKMNATALVAPGSVLGASFMLKDYEYGSAKVSLKDASKIDPRLLDRNLQVVMSNDVTKIHTTHDLMMSASHSNDSANAHLEIERLYDAREFKSIGFNKVFKQNNSHFIHLTTNKDLIPRPTLSMKLKVEIRGRFFKYHEVYNDEVPAALIETINAGYTVDLDQLPLKRKIPSKGKIRLSLSYSLQELDLKFQDEEVWVVKLKHVGDAEAVKEN